MNERRNRSQRVWSWVYLGIAILGIWCHWSLVGHSPPGQPTELVTTTTAYVFGALPYVVIDASGIAPQWFGLGLGIAATVLVAYARKRLMDWVERSEVMAQSQARPGA